MNPELLSQKQFTRTDYINQETQKETKRLMKQGGKVVDKVNAEGKVIEKGTPTGLPHSFARKLARRKITKQLGYIPGKLGSSEVASSQSRSERRKLAKENGVNFKPKYNGKGVKTFKEAYGIGNERFNNKFVTFK